MAQLKDLIVTGDARVVGNNYTNNPKIAFGTCATAAGTAEKVVVIDDPTWNLQVGDVIGVKFTNTNTVGTVKLNVNGTGAIQLAYNTSRPFTGSDNWITGYANRTIFYQYDGTYWYWVTAGVNQNGDTYTTAKSWTAAGTAAKTATCHDYAAQANSWIIVQMVYANTSASALTLNINNQGAKPIYINGSASSSSNYTLPKAHYLVFYNGTNYYFRTDGKIQGSITGDAATVNGKTVGVNVPADAKFTDNNTTYTFANGTNGFTVTPSGGSAQTVTVTPSISNNVTGSGTSGYIAKFNGANTITSGPQLGSSTTTYLRNNGTWENPQNVYVGSSAPSGSNYNVWVDSTGAVDNTALINLIYPVGSIYMSVVDTSPGILFGVGSWVRIAQGRTLIGEGIVEANNDDWCGSTSAGAWTAYAGNMGGEMAHKLVISEMPSHIHKLGSNQVSAAAWTDHGGFKVGSGSYTTLDLQSMEYVGGGQAHNNLPPYLVVYIWKRIE